jgi:hypothetical protein
MSITVIKSNLGRIPFCISPSRLALIPYEANIATTAFIKNTIQQLSQKPFISSENTLLTLSFFDINLKAEIIPALKAAG